MMRPVRSAGILAASLVGLYACLSPAERRDEIGAIVSGRVVEADAGAPVWGAQVMAVATSQSALTDSLGRFRLTLRPGRHEIRIEHICLRGRRHVIALGARPVDLDTVTMAWTDYALPGSCCSVAYRDSLKAGLVRPRAGVCIAP